MYKLLFILMLFTLQCFSQDQNLPRIDKDTLFTTCGYKIIDGGEITLGVGSMADGDFKYIRRNSGSLFSYTSNNQARANEANALSRSSNGHKYKIKKIEKRGNKKRGFTYYAKIGEGIINYEIDVENAISSGEIKVPTEYLPKKESAVVVKQEVSVADEIAKLKKLYDEGTITKEEFESQKKKLLEKE